MDYEKKYKETLERAKERYSACSAPALLEYIFPELKEKESEDDRTRKAILTGLIDCRDAPDLGWSDFGGINIDECIAWLEKQGEQTHAGHGQPEVTKTSDQELEPKFHPGDWVIDNCGNTYQIESATEIIAEHIFGYTIVGGGYFNDNNHVRLWSIQDAEDGDVLVASDGSIFLFASVVDGACKYYVALTTDNYIKINKEAKGGYWETSRAVYPATKEQRDLLFRKMADAGYEWDSEKKELKKAEPEFHEGDWAVYNNEICQIVKREEGCNKLVTVFGIEKEPVNERNLSTARLWTIADAKDGDVVVDKSDGTIGIFQSIGHHPDGGSYNDHSYCFLHCRYDDGFFYADFEHGNTIVSDDLIPATKEQRDLLFQKMKEAGYEWYAGKKELKKIGTKFNADDWIVTDDSFWKNVRHIDDINLINEEYIVSDENGLYYILPFSKEHKWHKWTIRDAEDGDVLASELTDFIFLFRGIKDNKIDFYCTYDTRLEWPEPEPDDRFVIKDTNLYYGRVEKSQDIHPATKGQRDLLFEKMKEEGYEWDGEKKELNKIKPKKLDPDKVIEWLRKNTCTGCWGDKADTAISQRIDRFKKDFRL